MAIVIERDYRTLPENAWWFNPVIHSIIQGFRVADKGTDYFDTSHRNVPFGDLIPMTINISVTEPGLYLYNNNARRPGTIVAPTPGTYRGEVFLERGRNTIRAINQTTQESSENVVYLEARELYGWIPAAVALQLLSLTDGITILKSLFNFASAPLEVLEEVYGKNICARLQPGQDEQEFRRILSSYYAAVALSDTVLALRTAPFGFDNIRDVWTSLHHLESRDSFFTYTQHIGDQSTWLLDRESEFGRPLLTGVVEGQLPPGLYRYFIRAVFVPLNNPVAAAQITVDVRHWGTRSALTLEWQQQPPEFDVNDVLVASGGSDHNYEIYRLEPLTQTWQFLATTRDHKYYDYGKPLNPLVSFTQVQVDSALSLLPSFRLAAGRNAHVRRAGHVTEQPLVIYLDNDGPVSDWQRTVVGCMYDELVPADVEYSILFLND